jgi:hypothetical protein
MRTIQSMAVELAAKPIVGLQKADLAKVGFFVCAPLVRSTLILLQCIVTGVVTPRCSCRSRPALTAQAGQAATIDLLLACASVFFLTYLHMASNVRALTP